MKSVLAAAVAVLLASCGSSPSTFHTLSPVSPRTGAGSAALCGAGPILVQRVGIPGMLDREALVSETAPGRIAISADHRWAGPLDGMAQRVLAEDLRARVGPGAVLAPGDPAPASGVRSVQVNILRFMPDTGGTVTLRADWSLLDRGGKPVLTRSVSVSEPGGRDPDGAVAAMSRALAGLADHIVASLPDACAGAPIQAR